jgi:hypothetical protein
VALPACQLAEINWRGARLEKRMNKHIAYYDGTAHYLKICMLFKQPFWRSAIDRPFFQLDRLGGCCVYDEGKRFDAGPYGVLNVLLAGTSAMLQGNRGGTELISMALDALPDRLGPAGDCFLEGKVHRWVGAVNAPSIGRKIRGPRARHFPDSKKHPGLFVVGDYLFDDTVNGVLDSADIASELVAKYLELKPRRFSMDALPAQRQEGGNTGTPTRSMDDQGTALPPD